MVNDTVIRNFFYTSTPEHEGVLFHIPSGRFFRVFDEKCKSDFRQIFEIGSLSEDVLEMLHKIDCKLRSNGMPVPLLRNGYSIFNGTKYR